MPGQEGPQRGGKGTAGSLEVEDSQVQIWAGGPGGLLSRDGGVLRDGAADCQGPDLPLCPDLSRLSAEGHGHTVEVDHKLGFIWELGSAPNARDS